MSYTYEWILIVCVCALSWFHTFGAIKIVSNKVDSTENFGPTDGIGWIHATRSEYRCENHPTKVLIDVLRFGFMVSSEYWVAWIWFHSKFKMKLKVMKYGNIIEYTGIYNEFYLIRYKLMQILIIKTFIS